MCSPSSPWILDGAEAGRGGRLQCAGPVLALQVALDVASSSRRWPACLPACSKRNDVTAREYRVSEDRKKTGKGGPTLVLQNYSEYWQNPLLIRLSGL